MANESSVQNAYEVIMKTFGRIDAVVASAGILFEIFFRSASNFLLGIVHNHTALEYVSKFWLCTKCSIIIRYPTEKMKRLFDINVNGVFFTAREAARHMIPQGGGSIILISSMSANVRFMSFTSINRR